MRLACELVHVEDLESRVALGEAKPPGLLLLVFDGVANVPHAVRDDGDAVRGDHSHDPVGGVREPRLAQDSADFVFGELRVGEASVPHEHLGAGERVVDGLLDVPGRDVFKIDGSAHSRVPPNPT